MIKVALMDLDIINYRASIACERDNSWASVQKTVDMKIREWLNVSDFTHQLGFLTNSAANYRNDVAVTWPYKGNRIHNVSPKWCKDVSKYMIDEWGAQMCNGIEADDALTIAQTHFNRLTPIKSMILTGDKDLIQQVGWHFNEYKSPVPFYIDDDAGQLNLWRQVITGDKTDNICGISHACEQGTVGIRNAMLQSRKVKEGLRKMPIDLTYGNAAADKFLKALQKEQYAEKVLELYIDNYECLDYDIGLGNDRFLEVFRLVYMLRTWDEVPKGIDLNLHLNPIEITANKAMNDLFIDYDA